MFYIDKNGKETVPPCIKNWIVTLKSMKYLWLQLKTEGFKYLILRNINQDSLENFFGCVRSHVPMVIEVSIQIAKIV